MKSVNKRQVAFILVAICLVGLIGIGVSYSYYLANISTSNEENKNSNITTTTITNVVMDMQGKVSSDGAYPGHKMVKEVVVRGIGESNSIPANAAILVTPDLGDFTSDVTWKLYKSDTPITCSNVEHTEGGQFYEEGSCNIPDSASLELEGGASSDFKNIVVSPNTETKYYLVVEYLNKENQNNQIGKSFSVDIGIGERQETKVDKIIATLDITGNCPSINSDGTAKITKGATKYGYLCSTSDDYGTTYYYRGKVSNNYVKFAGYYWRIVRINGDGTIRLIYDGTSAHSNGEKSTDRQVGTSMFNYYWKQNNVEDSNKSQVLYDNAGVGYMYGNRDKIMEPVEGTYNKVAYGTNTYYVAKEYTYDSATDKFTLKDPIAVLGSDLSEDYIGYYTFASDDASYSSSYELNKIFGISSGFGGSIYVRCAYVRYGTSSKEIAQTNINDSTMKVYLDTWYENNIKGTLYEKYITDNIFCNDRSYASTNTGIGAGASVTDYNLNTFNLSSISLKCSQKNDNYTVNDTVYGNGSLKYPIGLITSPDVILAGGSSGNTGYYLYTGSDYFTFSPANFNSNFATIHYVTSSGSGNATTKCYSDFGVKPVLNVSQDVLKNGTGTMSDPYRLTD